MADAMEGNRLTEPAFYETALLCTTHPVIRLEDQLATIRRALMVLLPSMKMILSLESLRTTGWTHFSHDYNALLPP